MRILGMDLELTQEDKDLMLSVLESCRKGRRWLSFVIIAAWLRILAADEIKVGGEKMLEIIDHKPKSNLEAKVPLVPDQRNF